MSVPFRERNPVIVGAVSLAVLSAMVLAAFRAEDLPLIGGGDTYYAAFSEAGGLKANDEVEVLVKFRDHLGPFVFHCHNIEHEDMAMMARFDVVLSFGGGPVLDELRSGGRTPASAPSLPTSYGGSSWGQLHEAMKVDKKSRGDTLRFVVLDALAIDTLPQVREFVQHDPAEARGVRSRST